MTLVPYYFLTLNHLNFNRYANFHSRRLNSSVLIVSRRWLQEYDVRMHRMNVSIIPFALVYKSIILTLCQLLR